MKDLMWVGVLNTQSGYGRAGYNYLQGLNKAGVNLFLGNCDPKEPTEENFPSPILRKIYTDSRNGKQINNRVCVFHCDPNVLLAPKLQNLIVHNKMRGIKNVCYTVFETKTIPIYWVRILEDMDMVLTASSFCRDSFIRSGMRAEKIKVIPHILTEPLKVDYTKSNPVFRKFIFGSIFDFVSKKGWTELLAAYWQEFKADEDVCLVIKVYPSRYGYNDAGYDYVSNRIGDFKKLLQLKTESAPIFYLKEFYDDEDMEALWKGLNCFVLPTRGEGFSLGVAEAMKREVPVITTDVGGHNDFLDGSSGTLVASKEAVVDDVETCIYTSHFQDKIWRMVDVDDLRKKMREVYTNYDAAKAKAVIGKKNIDERCNEELITKQLIEALELDDSSDVKVGVFGGAESTVREPKAHTRRPVVKKKE